MGLEGKLLKKSVLMTKSWISNNPFWTVFRYQSAPATVRTGLNAVVALTLAANS